MCEYGYVRVSTLKQKVERQIANIKKEYPNAVSLMNHTRVQAWIDQNGIS